MSVCEFAPSFESGRFPMVNQRKRMNASLMKMVRIKTQRWCSANFLGNAEAFAVLCRPLRRLAIPCYNLQPHRGL